MFNAMRPQDLTTLLAGLLAESAGWDRPLDDFQVGQLKSASSIGRHLAAELTGGPAAWAAFTDDLARLLPDEPDRTEGADVRATAGTPGLVAAHAAVATALEDGGGPVALGGPLADLLAAQRAHPGGEATAGQLRRLLRGLADAEIAVLSAPPRTVTEAAR